MTRLDMNKVNKLIEDGKQRIEKYNDEFMLLNCLTIAKKKNGEEYVNPTQAIKLTDGSPFTNLAIYKDDDNYMISAYKGAFRVAIRLDGYKQLKYNYAKKEYELTEGVTEERVLGRDTCRVPYYLLNAKELRDEIENDKSNRLGWMKDEQIRLDNLTAILPFVEALCNKANELGDLPYDWTSIISKF